MDLIDNPKREFSLNNRIVIGEGFDIIDTDRKNIKKYHYYQNGIPLPQNFRVVVFQNLGTKIKWDEVQYLYNWLGDFIREQGDIKRFHRKRLEIKSIPSAQHIYCNVYESGESVPDILLNFRLNRLIPRGVFNISEDKMVRKGRTLNIMKSALDSELMAELDENYVSLSSIVHKLFDRPDKKPRTIYLISSRNFTFWNYLEYGFKGLTIDQLPEITKMMNGFIKKSDKKEALAKKNLTLEEIESFESKVSDLINLQKSIKEYISNNKIVLDNLNNLGMEEFFHNVNIVKI